MAQRAISKDTDIVGLTCDSRLVEPGFLFAALAGARADGSIVMYNARHEEVARFNFRNGWPSSWKGPDVSADDESVAIEEITIAHEGLTRAL